MKQIHLFKKGFVIFLKGAPFSDFIETRLSNYKPLAIRFPLFWRIFFQLGSNLIKQWTIKISCAPKGLHGSAARYSKLIVSLQKDCTVVKTNVLQRICTVVKTSYNQNGSTIQQLCYKLDFSSHKILALEQEKFVSCSHGTLEICNTGIVEPWKLGT